MIRGDPLKAAKDMRTNVQATQFIGERSEEARMHVLIDPTSDGIRQELGDGKP